MPARLVQHQDHLYIRPSLTADEPQMLIHVVGVDRRGQQRRGLPGQRVDRRVQVDPLVLGLLKGRRSAAAFGPDARQGALLAEASLVLDPDLYPLLRVLCLDRLDKRGVASTQVAMAAGSFL